jgi:dual specificity phosphatase 12
MGKRILLPSFYVYQLVLFPALPLFNPTRTFLRHLELFEACNYAPTASHPLVQTWCTEEDINGPAYVLSNGKSNGKINGSGSSVNDGGDSGVGKLGKKEGVGVPVDMGAAAARALSNTGLDVKAFGDALARIQMHASANRKM